LVLWNPVLDLRHTFLEPELAWGTKNFGAEQQGYLRRNGFVRVDDEFELGRVLFMEFGHYCPRDALLTSDVPALIVHGDRDTAVSYEVAVRVAQSRPDTLLHTVVGSDHGFDGREREDEAIRVTIEWLTGRTPWVS
jgi:pimeloyl-ACP methyl ester carboxylesterase